MNKKETTPEKKTKNERCFVKYIFSNEEIHEKGADLARITTEHRNIENEKKAVTSQFKAQLDGKAAEIDMISAHINSGFEHRYVECLATYGDPKPGFKTITRKDTGEVIRTEAMTADELQAELPFGE